MQFLSTLSLRRATKDANNGRNANLHFYPRSPCGERLFLLRKITITVDISIHALLAESDNRFGRPIDVQLVFLSTLSLRRATVIDHSAHPHKSFLSTLSLRRATILSKPVRQILMISIHALLAESDVYFGVACVAAPDFYPRSPCGERQAADISIRREASISIHALLAESDPPFATLSNGRVYFYPRSPCGERHQL